MSNSKTTSIYTPILQNIKRYETEFDSIAGERKMALKSLALFIEKKITTGEKAELIFICTHNSRRSHMSQIWAQTAAAYYEIPNVITYSGGTEATAFNPRAVNAMKGLGFKITETSGGVNPVYAVRFDDSDVAVKVFSKKYDDAENPKNGFGAIMTCSHADENCPLVLGAAHRVATPYDDPKDFDGTPLESEKYTERAHQIGRDILYLLSLVTVK